MKIPDEIQHYLTENHNSEMALVGCRADAPDVSYDCCEYDIAIFGNNEPNLQNKIVKLGNNTLEIQGFSKQGNDILLFKMIRVKTGDLLISPPCYSEIDIKRSFKAAGKRRIVDALFNVSKNSINKAELNSPLNLKIAAYGLLEGILLLSEVRPMPIHELNQLRQLEVKKDIINEAIQTCIECLGIERATRTILNRSFQALKEILKERYDVELLSSKIEFLLNHKLLADCYYYIGRVVCSYLEQKDNSSQMNYYKLNSIALDLTSDYENIKKMSALLKRHCKSLLKN
ncbi:hypothetical protein BH18THE1_BH18THE1_20330 [soil metagenome]